MKGICSICRKEKNVKRNRKTGQLVCSSCYKREFYKPPQEKCSCCGRVKLVALRLKDGRGVCQVCYRRKFHLEECVYCKEVKPVAVRSKDGKPTCEVCYQQMRVGQCVECKKTRIIQALGRCYACYQGQRRAKMAA